MSERSSSELLPSDPEELLAARLLGLLEAERRLLVIAASETRAARLHAALAALAPGMAEWLPSWDCLPYDRVSPSREVMGRRMQTLARLSAADSPARLLIAAVEAVSQRLPPPEASAELRLAPGAPVDIDELQERLRRFGYRLADRAEAPGEMARHGAVIDIFPPCDLLPCRIAHDGDQITDLRRFDPLTQRSQEGVEALSVGPASELVLEQSELRHRRGIEHMLADFYPRLVSVFELLPDAALVLEPDVERLRAERFAEIGDAFHARLAISAAEGTPPSEPARLYLDDAAWAVACGGRRRVEVAPVEPRPALLPPDTDREEAALAKIAETIEAGGRVGLFGSGSAAAGLLRRVRRRLGCDIGESAGWRELAGAPAGTVAHLPGRLPGSFADGGMLALSLDEIRPPRPVASSGSSVLPDMLGLRPGDAVVHFDHGVAVLDGIEPVSTEAGQVDCLRLGFAREAKLLVKPDELDRLWRYGAEAEAISLDHLNTESWAKRRAEIEAEIARSASALAERAGMRDAAQAPVLRPPRAPYERFIGRFPYGLTPDQASAIEAVTQDLASGRPMDRLVCGDVGFGKTEVALRAAAIAALAGRQVALLAPTTVLVRQHLNTFRRRFAGLGINVAALSRLTPPAEARAAKAGLADGSIAIAIGTQALAARDVRFKSLALLVVDEEQRFGARQKEMLQRLGRDLHRLTLTATPIPRTLESALVGLHELSVIATPPARRQAIRTVQMPLDEAVVKEALEHEHRRGGQSFVVCSRIADMAAAHEMLARLVPDLSVLEAHGEMPPDAVDQAMVRFAEGGADILLSTNIIETGLDVPQANTMLVLQADRFGLAQLHQLRGRVGRGRVRGAIYLMTDPAHPPSPVARKRLQTLERFDRVGAGFAISARDMDLRGAGDLLGEAQAGHLRLIGVDLYRHLMQRALAAARGGAGEEGWTPVVAIAADAHIPSDYVPEDALRVEIYTRLGALLRAGDAGGLADLAAEIEDRFGAPAEPVETLFALAGLRIRCRRLGVARLDVGPNGAAATLRAPPAALPSPLTLKGERAVLHRPSHSAAAAIATAEHLLALLAHSARSGGTARTAAPADEAKADAEAEA